MVRIMAILIIILCLIVPAAAQDMIGRYCVLSESEWAQCIELKQGGVCLITAEVWDPGPKNMERRLTPCRYTAQGNRVLVTYGKTTDILETGVYDWAEFSEPGWSPGLKNMQPAAEGGVLTSRLVFWKEPLDDLRLRPRPR